MFTLALNVWLSSEMLLVVVSAKGLLDGVDIIFCRALYNRSTLILYIILYRLFWLKDKTVFTFFTIISLYTVVVTATKRLVSDIFVLSAVYIHSMILICFIFR